MSNSFSTLTTDPIRNFKFLVSFNHTVQTTWGDSPKYLDLNFTMGFTSVSGFSATTNAIPYRQGGYNTTAQMIPGQTSFTPISFQRGLLLGTKGFERDWFRELFAVGTGYGAKPDNNGRQFRGDIDVYVMNHPDTTVIDQPIDYSKDESSYTTDGAAAHFKIYNAWPTSVSYSDLNAGDNAFIVANITFAHEGFMLF